MRLYLSSDQLGSRPDLFCSLVRGNRQGWVVMNALDGVDEDRRVADTHTQIQNLASIGLTAKNFDLRDVTPKEVADVFGHPDFIWVSLEISSVGVCGGCGVC